MYYSETLPSDIPIIVKDHNNEIYDWFQNAGSFPLIVFIDHEMKVYQLEMDGIPSFEATNAIINDMLSDLEVFLENLAINSDKLYANSFSLHSLYPNPFNPVVYFNFDIPWAGTTQIEILDISGAHIETLHSGFLQSGSHEMSWNAESMPSGVYLVSLKSGNKILTEKVVLLK